MQTQNLATIVQHYTLFPTPLLAEKPTALGKDHFILYGKNLSLDSLLAFQQKCGENFLILDCWNQWDYTIVLFKATWQTQYLTFAHGLELDIAPLNFDASLSQAGLLVMDMDSTIIQMECIDEIAKLAGTGELVSSITAQAMRGELDFEQSLRRRVGTLKGSPEQILQQVRNNLPLMPGLEKMLAELQKHGWKTAIASGGFTYFADYLKETLKLDFAVSNQLAIENGYLTGEVQGDIVDAAYKAETLKSLAKKWHIDLKNTVAIGDGANDLAMMKVANLGGAFHAKPKVQQQAQVVVNFADLTALLCILSANDRIKQN